MLEQFLRIIAAETKKAAEVIEYYYNVINRKDVKTSTTTQ